MSMQDIVILETFFYIAEVDVCWLIDLKDSITALEKAC